MLNAGDYKHKISIIKLAETEDAEGFKETAETVVLTTYAKVKTTKGFTLVSSGTDFEKAYTNFTIRYPKTPISRDMKIRFVTKGIERLYTIEYLNNVDEANIELEIQAKEVSK